MFYISLCDYNVLSKTNMNGYLLMTTLRHKCKTNVFVHENNEWYFVHNNIQKYKKNVFTKEATWMVFPEFTLRQTSWMYNSNNNPAVKIKITSWSRSTIWVPCNSGWFASQGLPDKSDNSSKKKKKKKKKRKEKKKHSSESSSDNSSIQMVFLSPKILCPKCRFRCVSKRWKNWHSHVIQDNSLGNW